MSIVIKDKDPNAPWTLPEKLLSKEHLEQSAALQKELAVRVNSPFASKTAKDIEMFNARILIKELEAYPKLNPVSREYLAESCASIGEYKKAASITKNKAHKKRRLELWEAVWKDDEDSCQCEDRKFGDTLVNNESVSEDVFSLKHLKIMPAVRCSNCGDLNVKPLPGRIAKERGLRKQAISQVSGMKPEDAKAQLIANGHTSKLIVR